MKLTKKEQDWLVALEKLLERAPKTLGKKVSSYTIGDKLVTLFDHKKVVAYEETLPSWNNLDMCTIVDECDAEVCCLYFPFCVESTAG